MTRRTKPKATSTEAETNQQPNDIDPSPGEIKQVAITSPGSPYNEFNDHRDLYNLTSRRAPRRIRPFFHKHTQFWPNTSKAAGHGRETVKMG